MLEGADSASSPTSSAASFTGSVSGLEGGRGDGARTPDSPRSADLDGLPLSAPSGGIPLRAVKLADRCAALGAAGLEVVGSGLCC